MKGCPTCGVSFTCTANKSCWCQELPHITDVRSISECRCKQCTAEQIKAYLEQHPEKAAGYRTKRVQEAAKESYTEKVDYYIDESANWVFTTYYLLKRGYCCQNDCMHCPYGYKKDQ
jgi:hypothetical protein